METDIRKLRLVKVSDAVGYMRVDPTDGNSDNKSQMGPQSGCRLQIHMHCQPSLTSLVLDAKEQEMLLHLFVHLSSSLECLILIGRLQHSSVKCFLIMASAYSKDNCFFVVCK